MNSSSSRVRRNLRPVVRQVLDRAQGIATKLDPRADDRDAATSVVDPASDSASDPASDSVGDQEITLKQMPPRTYARLVSKVFGAAQGPIAPEPMAFDSEQMRELMTEIGRDQALSEFAKLISVGVPADIAQVETVRQLSGPPRHRQSARAFMLGMQQLPGGDQLRTINTGQILHAMIEFDRAWAYFADIDAATLGRLVPLEAVTSALYVKTPESRAVAVSVGEYCADPANDVGPTVKIELAGRFVTVHELDLARRLIDPLRERVDLNEDQASSLNNLLRYTHPTPAAPGPAGSITFGVIDYHQVDFIRSSANVGDYVQTLAMLGNLARFRDIRFTGHDGLGELAMKLKNRVRPELHLPGGDADVHLMPVSRDFSAGDPVPENTWMVAFGWHMHSSYWIQFGLPYHPNLNPIFVSFHLQRLQALTPEAIEYLKAHGPIGCRDWTTVYLLLSAGIDAFFTGCLTTTVSAVFPELADVERDERPVVGVIDLTPGQVKKIKRRKELVTHAGREFRTAGLAEGTNAAIDLLAGYQKRFSRVVTSRLHSYLPATSLGLNVRFLPPIAGDVRFDGLYDMTPTAPAFEQMRDGIRMLLAQALGKVFEGAEKAEVYKMWGELTAPLVEEAKQRLAAPSTTLRPHLDVDAAVAAIRASTRAYGPHDAVGDDVTDIALSLDENFKDLLPVTVESLSENASRPLRLWITTRGLDQDYQEWFAGCFPELPITFLAYDHVDYGEITRMIRHISIATMDRLLLPEVLDHLDRVTYVDIDTVTQGDVCELAAIDLKGFPLAARMGRQLAAEQWRLAGNLLDAERAFDLRRTMSRLHPFGFKAFNAGVLVLDLAKMRADNFVEEFVPYAASFGFNDQDILNTYAGVERIELDSKWNALPMIEEIVTPGIVHYAGAGKPWESGLVPFGELWNEYADKFRVRAGEERA